MKSYRIIQFIIVFAVLMFMPGCSQANETAEEQNAAVNYDNEEILFTIEGAELAAMTRGEFMALQQCKYYITRTNSKGETTSGDYSGVKWGVLAEAIGAPENAQSVTVIASDGFSQAYTMEILNADKSLFAIYKDGVPITEEADNGQIWFCADESFTANYWTKFMTKIVIN